MVLGKGTASKAVSKLEPGLILGGAVDQGGKIDVNSRAREESSMRAYSHFVVSRAAAFLAMLALTLPVLAQDQNQSSVTCAFEDGKAVSVRYVDGGGHASQHLRLGKMWTPADAPMYLFTQANLKVGELSIPVGAYKLYIIPEKDKWTLIVNRKVDTPAYDAKDDLGRADLGVGQLSEAVDSPRLALYHAANKQCNLRINFEKSGAWGEFHEQ